MVAGARSQHFMLLVACRSYCPTVSFFRKKDPKCIVALDLMDWKLDVAKKCGADVVLNPSKCNLIEEILKLTDDLGCDVYIEASGAGPSVR